MMRQRAEGSKLISKVSEHHMKWVMLLLHRLVVLSIVQYFLCLWMCACLLLRKNVWEDFYVKNLHCQLPAFSQHVCIKALIVPISLICLHVSYTPQFAAEQRHTFLGQHTTRAKLVTWFVVQCRAKWAWLKAQRRICGNKRDEGRKLDELESDRERRSRPQILPIRQTGSPQKAVLLTRRLMGKLIIPALYSSEGSTSPSLLPSLFLFYQAAVKCYLWQSEWGKVWPRPLSLFPAPCRALKIMIVPLRDSL